MNQTLCILGRQPTLGLAELESLYGGEHVEPFGDGAATLDITYDRVHFPRLGGTIKLCKILDTIGDTRWESIEKFLAQNISKYSASFTEGKLQVGLSTYGFNITPQRINANGLSLKKILRAAGHSVRFTPNMSPALSSAQVFHNHLTRGLELIVITDNHTTIIAQTTSIQDIDNYTIRDRGRPKRDARVGMLPPKLAQIIINLASPASGNVMLDPFCGTGVVLQEALLMGYDVLGSDLEPRMIEYTNANLAWLKTQVPNLDSRVQTEVGDATSHAWPQPINTVASETYLGRPFTTPPNSEILMQTISDCNLLITKFLKNSSRQLAPGTRLSLAVPAWQIRPDSFKHLPLIDQIEDLGYNRVRFEHVRDQQLLYYRENQFVARELLVITRK
jgi:tRNA G10  N-methylase Trm11